MTTPQQIELVTPGAGKDSADSFLLSEYAALRNEIVAKLGHIHQIVWLSLISQATVASWIILQSHKLDDWNIFLASLVSPALAVFFRWYRKNLTGNVQEIATYIKSIEERFLPENKQTKEINGWEHRGEHPPAVAKSCGSFASINTLFDLIAILSIIGVIMVAIFLSLN